MKIAVCDDIYEDAVHLKTLLVGQDTTVYLDAGKLLMDLEENHLRYDLYLLDIFLEDSMNGIELAKKILVQDGEAVICFVSSSNDFYREAYDLYAVQYLLKPVQPDALKQLIDKVSQNIVRDKEQSLHYKWRGQTGAIPYGKILFISSREHTLFIKCVDESVQECKGKLNEIELQLRSDIFSRCHQSFIVNMYHVDSLNGNELMVSGHCIPISRRYYSEIKRRYQELLFEEMD